ncbi:ATP-dependent Clp protease proteolytic subunit [Haloferula rosea]|uniref:ATP-dependent Clp protease proteolytic subunit n=1 Tax=Haloferula rosea TaxID=490093 RepID=A0A934RE34_9BACT|nr:ATP-dependent Clp protease proteolytic subunit [Haloferula rosea]MBK1827529.1 ATP-dependent Clp protease proteolytic subunit [Haloferula rosea]
MYRSILQLTLVLSLAPSLLAEDEKVNASDERQRLELENSLIDERTRFETAGMRAEIERLKAEKELLTARLNLASAKRRSTDLKNHATLELEKQRLEREAAISKARADKLEGRLKAAQAQSSLRISRLQNEIQRLEMEKKRHNYADAETQYLLNPLRPDGTLVISDRRIALNETITTSTADYITDRIHYYNNASREYPIFIVIDECPGGSVMAGCRIQQAMKASDAPVHVVVKSFAASMAAAITTLAEESYAYPDAMILHHQISWDHRTERNLTEQKDFLKNCNRWWNRFGTPIAEHMGITSEEFIRRMYAHSSSGDWREFAPEAKQLKWIKHVVNAIEESSFVKHPDARDSPRTDSSTPSANGVQQGVDATGKPIMILPRINPLDVYFLYNPDGYYRQR